MTMRHALDAAEPARYALLGLLLGGPRHGYDLARLFAPGTALGDVVHLGSSYLYALLARLERDGLVEGERQEQGGRPPRHVYRLTADGRDAVLLWLDQPVPRPRDMHLDFPLKLYTALHTDPVRAAILIDAQRALFAAYLSDLETREDGDNAGEDARFIALMRAGRIARTRAALDWLDRCADALLALQALTPLPRTRERD